MYRTFAVRCAEQSPEPPRHAVATWTCAPVQQEYNKHKNFLLFLVDGDNHEFNSQRIWNKAGIKGAVDGSPRGVLSLQGWVRKVLARSCTRSLGRGRLTKRLDSTKLNYRYNRVFPKELCWA
ncbi:unnamed protein product [Durusdinium trenchii]|uniref:Uncharacterized protein n=1 Tax=Durusdinium trenchii TaxID=1381693 RepID=A0ABP0P0S9_9DINO